jgi:5-carboxymethyl-2-hydroxymuconate isomerase
MPHVIVEYSTNLEKIVDINALLSGVHDAALSCAIVPADALRTRAEPRDRYLIADRHPANAFVAVVARLGPGRTAEEKHRLLEALLLATQSALGEAAANVMLSIEYQEIDAEFRINKNHLRTVFAARQAHPENQGT